MPDTCERCDRPRAGCAGAPAPWKVWTVLQTESVDNFAHPVRYLVPILVNFATSPGCANSLPPWNAWTEYQGVGWSGPLDANKLWQLIAGGARSHKRDFRSPESEVSSRGQRASGMQHYQQNKREFVFGNN